MNKLISLVAGFVLALTLFVTTPEAATSGGLYDMSRFLQEPHPFERTPVSPRLSLENPLVPPKIIVPNKKDLNVISSTKKPAELIKTPKVLLPSTTSKYTPISKPGYLSEVRVGLFIHDEGLFSRNKEDGIDTNFEVLFKSPSMLDVIWAPRPHLGATLNSAGNTSQAYLGLTWDWNFYRYFFLNFSISFISFVKSEGGINFAKYIELSFSGRFLTAKGSFSISVVFDIFSNKKVDVM